MEIIIYDKDGSLVKTINKVLTSSRYEKLDGTSAFSFSYIASTKETVTCGMEVESDGQCYSIIRTKRKISNGFPMVDVECEHVTNQLNDEKYNLVTFVFEGTPAEGLAKILSGTSFVLGEVEPEERVEIAFTEGTLNRRNTLIRFADAVGGELEYENHKIHIRKHRGSVEVKELMDGKNVTGLSATYDTDNGTEAYEISLFKAVNLELGDEIHIVYHPLDIDVSTRIVGIRYNPFYRYTVKIEVGDYVPKLMAASEKRLEEISQFFKAANGELQSTIARVDGTVSEMYQTVDGFDLRIENAEIAVSSFSQTIDSFELRIKSTEGEMSSLSQTVGGFDLRIATAEGAVTSMSTTVDGFDLRISNAEGAVSEFSQTLEGMQLRLTSAEGTVASFSSTLDGLTTRIESNEGNISSMQLTLDGMETRIQDAEGNLSTLTQTASGLSTKVTAVEKNYTTLSNSVSGLATTTESLTESISEVNQTATSLSTRLSTAESNISKVTQTASGLSSKVTAVEKNYTTLSGSVSGLATTTESLTESVSEITQTASGLSTKVSSLETSLTSVKSSVSTVQQTATSLTTRITSAEDDISEMTATANKISWLIKSGTSSSNFTLTDRAVSLVTGTIDLSGYVTITNLKTSGKTVIDGGNITSGTIDASKVTVKNLQINNVLYDTYPVITCSGSASNPVVTVGKDQLSNRVNPNKLMLYGTYIQIGDETSSLYTMSIKSGTITMVGTTLNIGGASYYMVFNSSREFRPNVNNSNYKFYLGTSNYPWHYGYFTNLYVGGKAVTAGDINKLIAGTNTSYYIQLNASRQLVPSTSNSSYPFSLGTSSLPWTNGYITNLYVMTSAKIGNTTSAKLGFFGTTPIVRKTVSTVSTSASASSIATGLNNLINALKGYGLIA